MGRGLPTQKSPTHLAKPSTPSSTGSPTHKITIIQSPQPQASENLTLSQQLLILSYSIPSVNFVTPQGSLASDNFTTRPNPTRSLKAPSTRRAKISSSPCEAQLVYSEHFITLLIKRARLPKVRWRVFCLESRPLLQGWVKQPPSHL